MYFKDLKIIDPILKALEKKGYMEPTPIQEQSIPFLLEGEDLLGCAQTGTGKTAAFMIPIIQQLVEKPQRFPGARKVRALIVTPTRELAIQIEENATHYSQFTGLKNTVIFGGVKQGLQVNALKRRVDILVATPGRLLDLMQQGFVSLRDIEYFVLDEADQMLDLGFINDIKKIILKLPKQRQSLFFSATMPASIVELSGKILGNPKKVTIQPEQATAEKVEQAIYLVAKSDKPKLLLHIIGNAPVDSMLVFARTKHGSDKVVRFLQKSGVGAAAIHGNKSQNARQRALADFKNGRIKVLIATDIAARGIDVSALQLVINYDLPNIPETYVHRIGRTGRAKASGVALSFCDLEEREYLRDIEKLIRQEIPVVAEHPYFDDRKDSIVKTQKTSRSSRNNHFRSSQKPSHHQSRPHKNFRR